MAATFMVIGAATWPLLAAALVLALLGVLRTRTADARSVQGILACSLLIYTCVLLPPIGDMAGWPRQLTGGFALLGFLTAIPSAVMLLRYFRRYVRADRYADEEGWPQSSWQQGRRTPAQWQVQLRAGLHVAASTPTAVPGAVVILGVGLGPVRLQAR